jgi:hypothetical protein
MQTSWAGSYQILIFFRLKVVTVDVFLRACPEIVILAIPVAVLVGTIGVAREWWIRMASLGCVCVSEPPLQLSTNSHKPRIIRPGELGHTHMVAVDSDGNIPR